MIIIYSPRLELGDGVLIGVGVGIEVGVGLKVDSIISVPSSDNLQPAQDKYPRVLGAPAKRFQRW